MKNQLQQIFEVNKVDTQLLTLRDDLEKIPARRTEMEMLLGEKSRLLEDVTLKLSEMEKLKRTKEVEIDKAESRSKELQGNLSQIKTNKEYQAALKEVSESKKNTKAAEDQILQLMTEIENLKKEKDDLEVSVQVLKVNFEKENAQMSFEEEKFASQIEELENAKKGLLTGLEKSVLAKYERIRKVRREAISVIESGTCRECNMRVAPQLYLEIQKLKDVYTCPSCHRILCLPEWQPKPTVKEVVS